MDIGEAKRLKAALDQAIINLIAEYETKTGLQVEDIEVFRKSVGGIGGKSMLLTVVCKVDLKY